VNKEVDISKGKPIWLLPAIAFIAGLVLITGGLVLGASRDSAQEPTVDQEIIFAPSVEDNQANRASSGSDLAETVTCPEVNSESEQCLPETPSQDEAASNANAESDVDFAGEQQDANVGSAAGSQQTDWVVPELLGENVDEASQALKLLGFTNVELVEFADRKPRNTVVYSSIKAGSKPSKSQKVTLGFVRYSYSSSDMLFEWREMDSSGVYKVGFLDGTDTKMTDVANDYAQALGATVVCVSFRPFDVNLRAPSLLHRQAEQACRAGGIPAMWPHPSLVTLYTLNQNLAMKTAITKNY